MAVYLIRCGESGPVKIGKAGNPRDRLYELQVAHWEKLSLLRMWEGAETEELTLHLKFSDLHIRGDWFHFSRVMLGDVGLVEIVPDLPAKLEVTPIDFSAPLGGQKLRNYLSERKISVEVFAVDLKVSPATIYRYINHERAPRGETMANIVRLTAGAVQPNDFFMLHQETEAA